MRHTILAALLLAPLIGLPATGTPRPARPNILIAIADDLSHVHTSFAGYPAVKTPAIDRVAREGVYFRNAFAPTPGCSPTRASFLTGRHPWQIEQAGTHASSFPAKYVAFPDLLEQAGYFIGMTGKGWSPLGGSVLVPRLVALVMMAVGLAVVWIVAASPVVAFGVVGAVLLGIVLVEAWSTPVEATSEAPSEG